MKNILTSILALVLVSGVIHAADDTALFGADWETSVHGLAFTDDFDSENFTYGSQLSLAKYVNPFIGFEGFAGVRGEDLDYFDDGRFVDFFGGGVVARLPLETTFLSDTFILNTLAPFGGIAGRTETEDYRWDAVIKVGVQCSPTKNLSAGVFIAEATNFKSRSETILAASLGLKFGRK